MGSDVVVAVAQLELRAEADPLTLAIDAVAEAAARGASLIAFPETWLPGYPAWLDVCPGVSLWDHAPVRTIFRRHFENSITIPGPETAKLGEAAARAGATVVLGAVERVAGCGAHATLYNSLLTFAPNG